MKHLGGILSAFDEEIVNDALNSWASLAESESLPIGNLLAELPKAKFIELLSSDKQRIVEAALDVLKRICFSSDQAVATFMTDDILKALATVLNAQTGIKTLKQCCWIAYDLANHFEIHAKKMFELGIFEALCRLLINSNIDLAVLLFITLR